MEAVRSGRADAYTTDQATLAYYASRSPCNTVVVGPVFGPGVLVIALQKNSPLTAPFNKAMLEVMPVPMDSHMPAVSLAQALQEQGLAGHQNDRMCALSAAVQ